MEKIGYRLEVEGTFFNDQQTQSNGFSFSTDIMKRTAVILILNYIKSLIICYPQFLLCYFTTLIDNK